MSKVSGLFVNTKKPKCSIHESGLMSYRCLKNSTKFDLSYVEVDDADNVIPNGYDFYVFNYHPIPMGWLDTKCIKSLSGIKMCLVLEVLPNNPYVMSPRGDFDCYLVLDPTMNKVDNSIYPFPRPLEIQTEAVKQKLTRLPIIGSFGFATRSKGFELLVEAVSKEFKRALIRINLPFGDYVPENKEMFEKIKRDCLEKCKKGIKIEFSNNFYDKKELIHWCSQNTINCFFYYRSMAGLSAVTDQAISSGRPMLTASSQTFRHVHPYIRPYPFQSIKSAIANSQKGVLKMQHDWHPSNFLKTFEQVLVENKHLISTSAMSKKGFTLRVKGKSKVADVFHALTLSDFVPPILRKARKYFDPHKSEQTTLPTLTPFCHTLFNSHSQFNEDLILSLLVGEIKNGFYVDIGANHPTFNSNTKKFYDKGWCGINIEPTKDGYNKLLTSRTRDTNLNIAVANKSGVMTLYELDGDTTLSTLNPHNAVLMSKHLGLSMTSREISVRPLSSVMDEHCTSNVIHFMSIDAEGVDLEVLQSNNWEKYRPEVIMVEGNNQYNEIVEYLDKNSYLLVYNNYYNCIFINKYATLKKLKELLQGWK